MFDNIFENRAICETVWENIVEVGRPQYNMAHMHCMLDT